MSDTIATGLGCAHYEVPLQTEFKAPLALQWIRRNFLFKYLPADPGLGKTRRNFPPGHTGSWELLSELSVFRWESFLVSQKLGS